MATYEEIKQKAVDRQEEQRAQASEALKNVRYVASKLKTERSEKVAHHGKRGQDTWGGHYNAYLAQYNSLTRQAQEPDQAWIGEQLKKNIQVLGRKIQKRKGGREERYPKGGIIRLME